MADRAVRRYELLRRLGAGGMAEVFYARAHGAEGFTKDLAVKRILPHLAADDEFRGRFIDEAKIVSGLQHHNIVQVIDLGRAAEDLFIAMEWVDGVDLEFLLDGLEGSPLPLEHALHVTCEVLKGLQFAHSRTDDDGNALGIVHRDVNPPNVLLSYQGDVKVGDFGVARSHVRDVKTTDDGVLGKIGYIAPESLAGNRTDARADLYSVGVLLSVMVTGRHPLADEEQAQALLAVLQSEFPVPGQTAPELGLPEELDQIVRKATVRDPHARYPDADGFRHEVSDLARSLDLTLGGDAFVDWVREVAPEPRRGEPCSETLVPGTGKTPLEESGFTEDERTDSMPGIAASAMDAPAGLVTLVFSDIEGSTTLWERDIEVMSEALELHNDVLRILLRRHHGYEVKTEGDSFLVAFSDPLHAIRWCLDAQVELRDAAWPEALLEQPEAKPETAADGALLHRGLRVRMGVHLGRPQPRPNPITGRMDYFGPTVNRCARVQGAAYGGQILITEWVHEAIVTRLPELGDPTVENLGKHHLKGVDSELGLFQILPPEVSGRRFGRIRTAQVRLSNVVPASTALVGRIPDRVQLADELEDNRLVTLVGPGGTGKTRLATEFAYDAVPLYRGGAWSVELAAARTAAAVCQSVADVLGVALSQGTSDDELAATVGSALAGRGPILIVLDNFEQVVDAAADTVGKWLQQAPAAKFLVTSQLPLGLAEELAHPLDALELPEDDGDAGNSEAVQLFVQSAKAVKKRFALTPENAAQIVEIVRELDGLPLAIELAAARMKVFSLDQLAKRLSQRFRVLAGGRKAAGRHETLKKTIQWSWDLLEPWEQSAMAQLSVFQGGFSLEAAEEVVDVSTFDEDPWLPDVIDSLQNRSLLRTWSPRELPDEPRFGMYESIRAYASEELARNPELLEAALVRHAEHYASVGREWADGAYEAGGIERLKHLSLERENIHAVAERALDEKQPVHRSFALKATLALDPLFTLRGPLSVQVDLLNRCLASPVDDDTELALGLESRARAYRTLRKLDDAQADLERALPLAATPAIAARMKSLLATVLRAKGKLDASDRLHAEATSAAEGWAAATAWNAWGVLAQTQGELDVAEQRYERALAEAQGAGSVTLEGVARTNLGRIAFEKSDWSRAEEHAEAALRCQRQAGDRRFEGIAMQQLGEVDHARGDFSSARVRYQSAIKILQLVGETQYSAWARANLGLLEHQLGHTREALSLYGSARSDIEDPLFACVLEALSALVHLENGDDASEGSWKELVDAVPDAVVQAPLEQLGRFLAHGEAILPAPPDEGDSDLSVFLWHLALGAQERRANQSASRKTAGRDEGHSNDA